MTTKEVLAAIQNDEAFAKTMAAIKDPQKAYEALQAKGLTDSFETFKKAAAEIKEAGSKLDAADVDAIVGGGTTTTTTATTASITAAAAAAGF